MLLVTEDYSLKIQAQQGGLLVCTLKEMLSCLMRHQLLTSLGMKSTGACPSLCALKQRLICSCKLRCIRIGASTFGHSQPHFTSTARLSARVAKLIVTDCVTCFEQAFPDHCLYLLCVTLATMRLRRQSLLATEHALP